MATKDEEAAGCRNTKVAPCPFDPETTGTTTGESILAESTAEVVQGDLTDRIGCAWGGPRNGNERWSPQR